MKKYARVLSFLIIFMLLFSNTVYADSVPFDITADSITLMDAKTGQVLYSKNPDAAYPPASTTKTMTALLTLEKCSLDDVVTIGSNPPKIEGNSIALIEGEHLTVRDLLYGLLLQSGNDCATALAEYISGSCENFAKLMNSRAKEIGCTSANFVNPSGLYDENHKMSSKDLATIVSELSKHDEFKEIATTQEYTIKPTDKQPKERNIWNEDRLAVKTDRLHYDGCIGGKTGYTIQSLHSYTAAAERNGHILVAAIVHNNNISHYYDAKTLLDYGYSNFDYIKLYSKGDVVGSYNIDSKTSIPITAANDFYYDRKKTENDKPTIKIIDKNLSNVSFSKNNVILKAEVSFKGEKIGTIDLCSTQNHILKNKTNKSITANSNNNKNIPLIIIAFLASIIIIVLRISVIQKKTKAK